MTPKSRRLGFLKHRPKPSWKALGAEEPAGTDSPGATVRLSPKAFRVLAELAALTDQDEETVLADSINVYKAIMDLGQIPPNHLTNTGRVS